MEFVANGTAFSLTWEENYQTPSVYPIWQHDPAFRSKRYDLNSSYTFASAGCLVCSLTMLLQELGYNDNPEQVAAKLASVGAFVDGSLNHPSKVQAVYPKVTWHYDAFLLGKYSSFVNWESAPANIEALQWVLSKQSCPVKVDFNPGTTTIDQHFVLALKDGYEPDPKGGQNDNLWVLDPWTGCKTSVLTYLNPKWIYKSTLTKVQRVLLGMRVWFNG